MLQPEFQRLILLAPSWWGNGGRIVVGKEHSSDSGFRVVVLVPVYCVYCLHIIRCMRTAYSCSGAGGDASGG